MLKRVGGEINPSGAVTKMKDAKFPVPFPMGVEFNSPVHGNWNIVHTGMAVPDSIQIYVCADNCMRGVVLTAAEMNAAERFSFVIVEEENLLNGNLEDVTIEGVTDVLNKRLQRPKAVLLFTVCLHHFLGCDLERVYQELEERFPDIAFMRCFMDPIMQKHGLTPDQKLRKAMFDFIKEEKSLNAVTLLGHDFALDESCDLKRLLKKNGYILKELPTCRSWEEYEKLGECRFFVSCYPPGKYGAEKQAERLEKKCLYLPGGFDYEEIRQQLYEITDALKIFGEEREYEIMTNSADLDSFCHKEMQLCEEALEQVHKMIGDTPIAIDYLVHPRPLGLAKLLLTHGFNVKEIYLDSISQEEKDTFEWLQQNAPDLELRATIQAKMRVLPREAEERILAVGQKAAWFTGSRNFVNMVQGGGLWGFDGIRKMAELLAEAYREEKDPKDLVIRKGWGCESCI